MSEDDTIRIHIRPRRRWPAVVAVVIGLAAASAAGAAWLGLSPDQLPVSQSAPASALPPLLTEADILARAPAAAEAYRFAAQPEIMVLQFPTLAQQAAALNRVAALVEKAGFPRDRVLALDELDRRIRALGEDPASFYYGHDYRAADLLRFFALARQQQAVLNSEEQSLEQAVQGWGWRPSSVGALITLVRSEPGDDGSARATILRHELSHGLYFTSPAYAKFSQAFWDNTLTAAEQAGFRRFLAADGYDTLQPDLVTNETQAYLMHTASERFFTASAVGITPARMAQLKAQFLVDMPPGWLRDCTPSPAARVSYRP